MLSGAFVRNVIDIDPICKNKDTLAYDVNYGTGWELLSGDERHTPILAKGDGFYDVENLNPGQRVWLNSEMEIIQAIKNNDIIIPEQERQKNQKFWENLRHSILQVYVVDTKPHLHLVLIIRVVLRGVIWH